MKMIPMRMIRRMRKMTMRAKERKGPDGRAEEEKKR